MNRFLIVTVLALSVFTANIQLANAQTHKSSRKRARFYSLSTDTSKYGCVINQYFSLTQRLKKYPFSKAVRIVLVSFRYNDVLIDDTIASPSETKRSTEILTSIPDTCFTSGLHILNNKLNYSSLKEIKELNQSQINNLSELFFNMGTRSGKSYFEPGYSCFEPRNAIIFYDQNGKVFDYLEICFECHQVRAMSEDKLFFPNDCIGYIDVLKNFFVKAGIKYGSFIK